MNPVDIGFFDHAAFGRPDRRLTPRSGRVGRIVDVAIVSPDRGEGFQLLFCILEPATNGATFCSSMTFQFDELLDIGWSMSRDHHRVLPRRVVPPI